MRTILIIAILMATLTSNAQSLSIDLGDDHKYINPMDRCEQATEELEELKAELRAFKATLLKDTVYHLTMRQADTLTAMAANITRHAEHACIVCLTPTENCDMDINDYLID